ncbi:hypothetical protein ACFX5Q_05345 [Mesorhizobium sp. IMUNJ 23033]
MDEKGDDRQPDKTADSSHEPEQLSDLVRFLTGRIERRLDACATGTHFQG